MNRFERLINHPGRKLILQCIDYICIAATPPSKGGETYSISSCNKTMLRLTAMWPGVGFLIIKSTPGLNYKT